MINISSHELISLINSLLLPLTRILALLSIAPPFGNVSVPGQVKILFGVMLAFIVQPSIPPLPDLDPTSLTGITIVIQQIVIGLALGFIMRMVFAGFEFAGTMIGLTMGLGFATFFDPQTQGNSSAISQFVVLVATVIFLALNMHLSLLMALMESFHNMPITQNLASGINFEDVVMWGGEIFSIGLKLSLPIIAGLLITNIALGILTRAAPQLNLFGIGFPITIGVGFLLIGMALPYLALPMEQALQYALKTMHSLTVHPAAHP